MTKPRRINFFAGPGAGKSTTSAWLFAQMKMDGYNVELVDEYVKNWAYEDREPTSFDQIYLFAKQARKEDLVLRNGVDFIISDSPLMLSASYAKKNTPNLFYPLRDLALQFDEVYKPLNIFLYRESKPYNSVGRYQTLEEAKEMDAFIEDTLKKAQVPFFRFPWDDREGIKKFVIDMVK